MRAGFDWTIVGLDPGTRRIIWGVECSTCGWTKPTPGAERLEPSQQDAAADAVIADHPPAGCAPPV